MLYFSVECYFWAICMHSSLQVHTHTYTHTHCDFSSLLLAKSWFWSSWVLVQLAGNRHKYYKTCKGEWSWLYPIAYPSLVLPLPLPLSLSLSDCSSNESMHWVWPKCLPSAQINKPAACSLLVAVSLCLSVRLFSELNCSISANAFTGWQGPFMHAPTANWFYLVPYRTGIV